MTGDAYVGPRLGHNMGRFTLYEKLLGHKTVYIAHADHVPESSLSLDKKTFPSYYSNPCVNLLGF
jgi:hypothetical protein